jgi:hypothetical protein
MTQLSLLINKKKTHAGDVQTHFSLVNIDFSNEDELAKNSMTD